MDSGTNYDKTSLFLNAIDLTKATGCSGGRQEYVSLA